MSSSATKDIIAIGGSAGSRAVLKTLFADLPSDLPASIFVSTHIPANSPSLLPEILADSSNLPVRQAVDGQPIERGHIYVAAPDRHLLLMGETIKFGAGPRENMVRPSIDPMFRSAALSFGPRAVGLVLTGMLNDGAAGLHAIKSHGGTTVVQHPLDAEADQMPLAALEAVEVDHVASAAELGGLLVKIAGSEAGPVPDVPSDDLRLEVEIAAGDRLGSAALRKIASPSALTCPDCHGVLSEVRGSRPLRFRCQIGHAYTADVLASHIDELDEAIRIAMRIMEERLTLVERMARDARATGRNAVAELYEARAAEYRQYSTTLRDAALSSLRHGRASPFQDI
ncbi:MULTISPECIES: chemotaxis protein CheB [unclassified Rhizobium]|uniref:chemotaxis protein CheB n=1 Tax=unclassified Rhizobium TaxID=2613769 RepID=UPI0007EB80BF|nr:MULTISPECIES: chemotaxis protein CheB [unclassified Rhizobium]ANK87842.1 protein-glutamate methylesterase CheB-type protein [Rhizobium sp. N731]ANL18088.1 protein-glutamate methylesterase CheB-type protein [Rhizobium sp. N1314]